MKAFFHLSTCETCKRIIGELNLNETIERIDVRKRAINSDQLDALHKLTGSYEVLFNKRAQLYKQRKLKEKPLEESDYKRLILEHYTFLRRPVLIFNDRIFVGNSSKIVERAKLFLNEQ